MFYLIPLQSGNNVNGFVIFIFDENINHIQRSFFGLVGNMIASAFSRLRTEMKLHELQLTNEFILRALPDWLYIVNKNRSSRAVIITLHLSPIYQIMI